MNDITPALWPHLMLFALVCGALLVLPFVPAWREWRHPSDSAALKVSPSLTSDTGFLAQQFRELMQMQLAGGLTQDHQRLGALDTRAKGPPSERTQRPIVSTQAIRSLVDTSVQSPLYVTADVHVAGRARLREVLCVGGLTLGAHSHIGGWAHADQAVVLGEASVVVRRVSSARSIDLARHCCFERLHAPTLRFGQLPLPGTKAPVSSQPTWHRLRRIPGAQRWGDGAWRVDGDCDIPAWHHFCGSLVVMGVLRVGDGALVEGNVKAHQGIHIGPGARVTGAVVCEGGIHLLQDAVVGGPLVSETHVLLHTRSRVGAPDAPTTVSATHILIDRGVTTHGTVWARDAGVVLGLT